MALGFSLHSLAPVVLRLSLRASPVAAARRLPPAMHALDPTLTALTVLRLLRRR